MNYLVRYGVLGDVGRFRSPERRVFARADRVVLRTARGLETGLVLAEEGESGPGTDGTVLRRMGVEDDLLASRIERRRERAYQACADLLAQHGSSAVLMEVEHLFDGQTLLFYFLGEVSHEVERLTAQLAEAYEAKAQFRKFTETLTQGCGPGCGTAEAMGQGGCASCSGCAVSGACGTKNKEPRMAAD
ncbi:hypothetical protein Pla175_10360 [Pirellulimonas nuda]|uniref:PSP1 C-terminal domain-containing protein n=1 Tax=Pirellulimonas nuda TaxID=2528009 RepID=A0A518D890_9BACT|nr:PSP1 C-terminal domain-containing protein [Pirellulimonas nuda]QDU87670.1 hypothetical protein Pla175_10360 [Pirellulimonas nuda]